MLILVLLLIPITILENANILPNLLVVSPEFSIGTSFLIRSIIFIELTRRIIEHKRLNLKTNLAIAFILFSLPFYLLVYDMSGFKMLSVVFYFLTTFAINIVDIGEKYIKKSRIFLNYIGVFITSTAVIEFIQNDGLQGRVFGIVGDEYATIVFFYVMINFKRNWPLFSFHVFGLLLTGSIGVLIGIVLTWFIFLFRRFRIASIGSILIAGVVFIVIINLDSSWSNRLVDKSAMNSLQLRIASLQIAQELLLDHWLLGVGIGNYSAFAESSSYAKSLPSSIWSSPYNQTLKIIIEFGIIGLLFWVLLLRDIVRKAFQYTLSPYVVYLFFLFIGVQSAVYLLPASMISIYVSYSLYESNRST